MKKIKLFALTALFCVMGTNAFAVEPLKSATKVFTFEFDSETSTECTITGFVAELDAELKAAVAIPETVTHPTLKDGDAAKKFFVKKIKAGAFAGEPIETITFPAAVEEDEYYGISKIGEGAFAGTKIQTLDLTNTIIDEVPNLFGTAIGSDPTGDKPNATLKSVILPASVTKILTKAFENCTKLATVDMSAATKLKTIETRAFANCAIKNFDLSKTIVTSLEANTLCYSGREMVASALETITLHKTFTSLNGNLAGAKKLTTVSGHIYVKPSKEEVTAFTLGASEFKGCTALTTIDTHKIKEFPKSCFEGCSALASLDISAATTIGEKAFAGTALTSVTIPANTGLTTIGASAFFECASLGEVTLATFASGASVGQTPITTIGANAFGYTAIEEFTLPAKNASFTIAAKAFVGCSSLTDFTYAPEAQTKANAALIDKAAFNRCSGVKFHTTEAFAKAWRETYVEGDGNYNGPTNTKFDYSVNDGKTKFTLTPYKSNNKKYYAKWSGSVKGTETAIKIKKGDAKVYAAYVDVDGSLNLTQYYADNGWIYIRKGDAALIITTNADLVWEKQTGSDNKTTSWQDVVLDPTAEKPVNKVVTGNKKNALKYVTEATTRASLESEVDEGWYIYGWVNTTSACGFQKIASGTTINPDVMFAWGKPAANGRLTVKWYDENGNLEAETTAIDSEATAINGVKAAAETEGQRYNVAGQKVSASYKGLVIKDGKKYMQK